jgi:hypothetical protein
MTPLAVMRRTIAIYENEVIIEVMSVMMLSIAGLLLLRYQGNESKHDTIYGI